MFIPARKPIHFVPLRLNVPEIIPTYNLILWAARAESFMYITYVYICSPASYYLCQTEPSRALCSLNYGL